MKWDKFPTEPVPGMKVLPLSPIQFYGAWPHVHKWREQKDGSVICRRCDFVLAVVKPESRE